MQDQYFEAQYPVTVRENELQRIMQYVKDGTSCQIVGIPGVSRSTVLGLLANNRNIRQKHLGDAQKRMHFVLVDFSEIRNRSLFDTMKYLFLNLTESLRERGLREENIAVGDKFREHLQFNDELVLFQGFKEAIEYMAYEKNMTTVFLFDRFEEYIPTVTSDFFANLRILRNKAKYQFSVVFSLNRPLEDLLEPALLSDYYEYIAGHIVYLSLADEALSNYRLAYIEKITGKKIQDTILKEVLSLSGGHGKVTKLAIEAILSQEELPKDIESFILSQKTIKGALNEIWFALTPAEQADLLEEKFTDKDVDNYLEQVGLIRENTIQIPLFAHYIAQIYKGTATKTKIVYDQNTNTIRKGDDVLSDQLTSSEFRLLRYLLQNPERIVERDEIISVVWQDVKSTAGITDQAVDQLVFRVRRKIEEDANQPAHLHTVKGRGFKFTA